MSAGQLTDLLTPVKVRQAPVDDPQGEPQVVDKPGIILGKELAMRLGVFPGDTLNVVSPVGPISAMGMVPKIRTFAVVGLFHSGMYEYDSSLAYIDLAEAQKFFNMGATVSGIEVKVTDVFRANDIAHNIEGSLGFVYGARDWMQMNRNLFSALKLEKTMMFLLLVLITIVASFVVLLILALLLTHPLSEKVREKYSKLLGFWTTDISSPLNQVVHLWGYEDLNAWLHKPAQFAQGTRMAFAGINSEKQRADMIAYLRSLSKSPIPLP